MLAVALALVLGADDPAVAAARVAGYAAMFSAIVAAAASVITNARLGRPSESIAHKVAKIEHERGQDRELLYLIARKVGVPVSMYDRRRQRQDEEFNDESSPPR